MIQENTFFKQPDPDTWVELFSDAVGGQPRAVDLFQRFLKSTRYSRQFVLLLIDVARGEHDDAWAVRRLAALMLQEHLQGLDTRNCSEYGFVLQQLGLMRSRRGQKVNRSVLKEGYTRCDLSAFILEFHRRLKRPRCAIRPRSRRRVTSSDIREFLHLSQQECRLVLGRYLFSAEEVAARIGQRVEVRTGLPLLLDDGLLQDEAQPSIVDLPDFEASILRKLRSDTKAFWVSEETSSELNALVEYPLGTVVLVVKPPGSHYEFQLKRAGRRGEKPLSVRSHVPPSHRLDGGSMLSALQWDVRKTTTFDGIYREVHGTPAPISRIVNLVGKFDVPLRGGAVPIVEYLTNPQIYGTGHVEMRRAMATVVECFRSERGDTIPPIPGDYGLTMQFVTFTSPAQAIVCGSSSFRLDLVAKYLSEDGPSEYFTRGLNVEYDCRDAKMLADDVLDEVLGIYHPPAVDYRDHDQYVSAALAVPKNRTRADAVYGNLLKQTGTMWGTLLAVRGYSFGESFVARNVGLRTIWSRGKWRVRLIFQDHDNLVVPGEDQSQFWPMTALPPTEQDERLIVGMEGVEDLKFESTALQRIYRADDLLRDKGRRRLRSALKSAYLKTQHALRNNPRVKSRFDKRFVERLRDWDSIARKYLARNGSSDGARWKTRVRKFLEKRGYSNDSIEEHCRALEQHSGFVEKCAFLYRGKVNDG